MSYVYALNFNSSHRMNTVFRILLAESWKQECDSGDVEDDQHTNDVDEDPLTIFLLVTLVAPDCLLQVTHKGGRTSQGQNGWAKILKMKSLEIKTKTSSVLPDGSEEPGRVNLQRTWERGKLQIPEPTGEQMRSFLSIFSKRNHLASKQQGSQKPHPAVQSVHVGLRWACIVVAVKCRLKVVF